MGAANARRKQVWQPESLSLFSTQHPCPCLSCPQVPIFDILKKFNGEFVHEDIKAGVCAALLPPTLSAHPADLGRQPAASLPTPPLPLSHFPTPTAPRHCTPDTCRRAAALPPHAAAALPGAARQALPAQPVLCGEEPHHRQLPRQEPGPCGLRPRAPGSVGAGGCFGLGNAVWG